MVRKVRRPRMESGEPIWEDAMENTMSIGTAGNGMSSNRMQDGAVLPKDWARTPGDTAENTNVSQDGEFFSTTEEFYSGGRQPHSKGGAARFVWRSRPQIPLEYPLSDDSLPRQGRSQSSRQQPELTDLEQLLWDSEIAEKSTHNDGRQHTLRPRPHWCGQRGASLLTSPRKRRCLATKSPTPQVQRAIRKSPYEPAASRRNRSRSSASSSSDTILSLSDAVGRLLNSERGPYIDTETRLWKLLYDNDSHSSADYQPLITSRASSALESISKVFLSQLLPRSFSANKRLDILHILRSEAPYLPTCIAMAPGQPPREFYGKSVDYCHKQFAFNGHAQYPTIAPIHSIHHHLPLGPSGKGYTPFKIPNELWKYITDELPRESILNMRLVNKEFCARVDHAAFESVVVVFSPEIYHILVGDSATKTMPRGKQNAKGKAKASESEEAGIDCAIGELAGKTQGNNGHDGMRMFEKIGPLVRHFGMSFETDEDTLSTLPAKGRFDCRRRFWGTSKWPFPHYSRYERCAGLEKKADETGRMAEALSYLCEATELGLSIDSGLGWLSGPDVSDRTQLFKRKSKIFGTKQTHQDSGIQSKMDAWKAVTSPTLGSSDDEELDAAINDLLSSGGQLHRLDQDQSMYLLRSRIVHQLGACPLALSPGAHPADRDRDHTAPPIDFEDINIENTLQLRRSSTPVHASGFPHHRLSPNSLTSAQKEWLLETEWAQNSFLLSYCLAIMDNSSTFQNVRTFTIAKLSSRFLGTLQQQDIWSALPNLNTLTVLVAPDWRDVEKQASGLVTTTNLFPSNTTPKFYNLLAFCIAATERIKTLTIGYVGGGEHATGLWARNRHVLPAPIFNHRDQVFSAFPCSCLNLPYVEKLTITNCWMTPGSLKSFISVNQLHQLQSLKLESVSLTAHSNITRAPAAHGGNGGVMPQQALPAPVAVPAPNYQTNPGVNPPTLGAAHFIMNANAAAHNQPFPAHNPPPPATPILAGAWVDSLPVRRESWGDVINAITPGDSLEHKRHHVYGRGPLPAKRSSSGSLRRVEFISCGHVRLNNMHNLDQDPLPKTIQIPPVTYLEKRFSDTGPVMMDAGRDPLLGSIVPGLVTEEEDVLVHGFGMEVGWENEFKKHESREDGQLAGGSGRFSGVVERAED